MVIVEWYGSSGQWHKRVHSSDNDDLPTRVDRAAATNGSHSTLNNGLGGYLVCQTKSFIE
jgi:hypothetical protein